MADFLFPSANVVTGDPVAIADLRGYQKLVYTDVKHIRQHSEHTTPDGTTQSENTITNDRAGTTKYELVFTSISGQPAQRWTFASEQDVDDEIDVVVVALGGS